MHAMERGGREAGAGLTRAKRSSSGVEAEIADLASAFCVSVQIPSKLTIVSWNIRYVQHYHGARDALVAKMQSLKRL